jgi:dihydroorotate dehydrogenase
MKLQHLEHKLRPFLHKILSEKAFTTLYSVMRNKALHMLQDEKNTFVGNANTHPVKLFGKLQFRNDLGNAAGFDKDGSLLEFNYNLGAGFAVVGTVLNKNHTGNVYQNYNFSSNVWTPLPNSDSAINSLGLPSKGVDYTIDNIKKFRDKIQNKEFPIGLSIMGHPADIGSKKHDGVLECIEKAKTHVDFFEINESCPNVCHGDGDLEELQTRLKTINQAREFNSDKVPTFIKMGNIPDAKSLLKLLILENIEGLVALNTQTDYENLRKTLNAKDQGLFDYYTKNYKGGLSGKVIKEISFSTIDNLNKINQTLGNKVELVHVGGISTPQDVQRSRSLCKLREWYTCFMTALGTQSWDKIYPSMTAK